MPGPGFELRQLRTFAVVAQRRSFTRAADDLHIAQQAVPTPDIGWRNHGTAVMGEFGADVNGFGTTGIAPGAFVRGASIFGGTGSANTIQQAADALSAGDIILLELHRPGPRFNFAPRNDQRGYIAIEWWPDDLAAVLYATSKGIIVVGAGGNGAEDLDDPIYDAA